MKMILSNLQFLIGVYNSIKVDVILNPYKYFLKTGSLAGAITYYLYGKVPAQELYSNINNYDDLSKMFEHSLEAEANDFLNANVIKRGDASEMDTLLVKSAALMSVKKS